LQELTLLGEGTLAATKDRLKACGFALDAVKTRKQTRR
jgi:hypothetical protein